MDLRFSSFILTVLFSACRGFFDQNSITGKLMKVKIDATAKRLVEIESNKVKLFIQLDWNITYIPKNLSIDGLQVYLGRSSKDSLMPLDECYSRSDFLWVKTNNVTDCNTTLTASKSCPIFTSNKSTCLCSTSICGKSGNPRLVRGRAIFLDTSQLMAKKFGNPITYPLEVRRAKFPVEFHTSYQYHIRPYYRYFIYAVQSAKDAINYIYSCPKFLTSAKNYTHKTAEKICCDSGVPLYVPHAIEIGNFRPNFEQESINATISWLPPMYPEYIAGFHITTLSLSGYQSTFTTKSTQPVVYNFFNNPNTKSSPSLNDCDRPYTYKASAEIFNLNVESSYRILITTIYNNETISGKCHRISGKPVCSEEFIFNVTSNVFSACDAKWKYCDANAICKNSRLNPLKVVCKCKDGFEGNGINPAAKKSVGTGCTDINSCINITDCDKNAICVDFSPPFIGFNCSCLENYEGDGYINGTGCTLKNKPSNTVVIIVTTVATVLVIVLILIAALVKIYKRVDEKRKRRLSLFEIQSNDNGIVSAVHNITDLQSNGPWKPTFGEKWEIPMKSLNRQAIIGRGYYGIVYKATLTLKTENSGSSSGYESVDGDTHPLNVEQANVTEISRTVAVKTLHESQITESNILQFLSEIGFMLNLEKHNNILGIIGCCTTSRTICLVTEYLQYGDLLHFLWNSREPEKVAQDPIYKVNDAVLINMSYQIASGMEQLSRMRIIHSDLAARNILVGTDRVCKISDFGLASDVYRYDHIHGQIEKKVPVKWASPERLMGGKVPITYKSDVWSFGNLLYELFTLGCAPHHGISSDKLLDNLRDGYRMEKPHTCSPEVYNIMTKCWEWKPSSRPSFRELVKLLDPNRNTKLLSKNKRKALVDVVEELDQEAYNEDLKVD